MYAQLKMDFLHAMFQMKSLLASELGKAGPSDVSMPEYILLKGLAEKTGSLSEIREYLAITKSAVSQMLSSLEKKGFLRRETDPTDRRNVLVTLTPAGELAFREKDAAFNARFGSLMHAMSEDTLRQAIDLTSSFHDTFSRSRGAEQGEEG